MTVGLWAANSGGHTLIEESSSILRFKRKVTTTGHVSPPTASSTEVVAIRKTGWGYNTSKTYYIFDFSPTPINYGLEVRDSSGKTQVSLSEGYARIVGANRITVNPRSVYTQRFDNYPAGTYAVIYPYLSSGKIATGYTDVNFIKEDFIVNSNGFLVRTEVFAVGYEQEYPWYNNPPYYQKTVLLIDVAGL